MDIADLPFEHSLLQRFRPQWKYAERQRDRLTAKKRGGQLCRVRGQCRSIVHVARKVASDCSFFQHHGRQVSDAA